MKVPAEFDVFTCSLDGINLIEASAGTGKTWNICGLYLRLLLERDLDVQQILVVTFTNAATAELRERTRSRIVEALAWLRDGDEAGPSGDPFVAELVRAVEQRTDVDRPKLASKLDQALQYFDEAAIFTIHGFCQRALADASFSAGLPFSLELVTDDSEMALEAVQDFWRRRVAGDSCSPELAAYLIEKRDTPENYAKLLRRSLAKPLARYRWPAGLDAPAGAIDMATMTRKYEAAEMLWAAQRTAVVELVKGSIPALHKGSYKEATIDRAAAAWDAYFLAAAPLAPIDADDRMELLSTSRLQCGTNKNQTTPTHAFFDAAEMLFSARAAIAGELDLARARLIRDLIDTVGPDLRRRKHERRVISFDDMLYNLHAALEGGEHPELASSLREKFPVALIDEFQDTDPLQFAIFDRIYGQGKLPVFLVGDPKQAIYSFRNADLHAYLRARESAAEQYTLAHNQRSTQGLIEALNGLFSTKPDAFMLKGLDYHPVEMGTKPRKPFSDKTAKRADLQVWTLPPAPEGGPILKTQAKRFAAQATAAEIARLVGEGDQGRITISKRHLQPGDIAVLVRTHAQGSEVKRELAALGIGSVEMSQASVFQTPDAEEVERVLIAINQPSRDALLRGALATEMMGCDAAKVTEISADEAALMGCLQRFAGYRDVWLRQGVGVMYRKFLTDENVSARMLRRDDGERRLTNLLHLGEQIHQAAATHGSPDALLRWLATKRRDGAADEVAQLRLESDRNLVKIVTIHKAKGLEFAIVFCPFLWDGRNRFGPPKPEGQEYHDADKEAVIDFRPRRRDRRRGEGNRPSDQARGFRRIAAPHLRGTDARDLPVLRDCRHLHVDELRQADDGGEHEEPPQLARRRRQRDAAELARRQANTRRHRRRLASLGHAPGTPPRPRSAARPARHAGCAGPTRTGNPRRPAPAKDDRARVALQQLFRPFERREKRDRRERPRHTDRGRGEEHRRAAAGHRAGRHPALSARHGRRRVPARDLRAHRLHRPRRLERRHRPRLVRASAIRRQRARGGAIGAAREHDRTNAERRDAHDAAGRHRPRLHPHHPSPHRARIQPASAAPVGARAQRSAREPGL